MLTGRQISWLQHCNISLRSFLWNRTAINVVINDMVRIWECFRRWCDFWRSLHGHVNIFFFPEFVWKIVALLNQESENSWEVFSLKEKQVLFNFKGQHDVLQQRVSKNHKALCWLSYPPNGVHVMKVFNSHYLNWRSVRKNLARAFYHSSDFDSTASQIHVCSKFSKICFCYQFSLFSQRKV